MKSPGSIRHLLVTRRPVGTPASAHYLRAWNRVRVVVEGAGGRAWVFRHADEPGLWLEFVEWQQEGDLPARPEIRQARDDLEGFGAGRAELWREPRETAA